MKIAFITLGCPKNQLDTEVMQGLLQQAGFSLVETIAEAQTLVINTCSFIEEAREEAIHTILEAGEEKKAGRIRFLIVTGCLPQFYPDLAQELEEVDAFLGTGDLKAIPVAVQAVAQGESFSQITQGIFNYNLPWPRFLDFQPGPTAYLRIAEGCNNHCSYCLIPSLRGPYRSRPLLDIRQEAESLVAAGKKELILIAQDTGAYGQDRNPQTSLAQLLNSLSPIPGLHWIRILYLHPQGITPALLKSIQENENVLPYLDIPVQHVSPRILARMNRGGGNSIQEKLQHIQETLPGVFLRTTLMVGFPGEEEEDFQELVQFVKEVRFHRLGVFCYSQEEQTEAATFPSQIPKEIKEKRRDQILTLQQKIARERNESLVGETMEVLVEQIDTKNPPLLVGRSQGDAPEIDEEVYFTSSSPWIHRFAQVRIIRAGNYELLGEEVP